jgi:four helix bundle protein
VTSSEKGKANGEKGVDGGRAFIAPSRFEGLQVWQKAKTLSVDVYRTCRVGGIARDFGLRDQMQRASVSVMSNIAEGYERYSRPEFKHFLSISRGSVAELRSQLYLASELGYIEEEDFRRLLARCIELTRMLTSLRKSLG